jgi:hypothetical protein
MHGATAALFAAGILARLKGPVLWCLKSHDLFAPALAGAGLHPDRVIYVEAGDEKTVLLTAEEGLRHGGLAGVVGELARLPMAASRRLQLAAESSGVVALILRRWRNETAAAEFGSPTAATSRWRITALPSTPLPTAGVGRRAGMSSWSAAAMVRHLRMRWRLAMRKVISLFLPTWPTDRLRRQSSAAPPLHEPLVTSGQDGNRRIIFAADSAAQQLSLRPGLVIAEARARVPNLHVIDADPVADNEALERLAQWCLRYSPVVALDAADGLWIEATGATHLFGGDEAMLRDIVNRLDKVGVSSRAAMAETPGAAHALARYAASPIFVPQPGQTVTVSGALPISLGLAPRLSMACIVWGSTGSAISKRFPGAACFAVRLELGRRLDQALASRRASESHRSARHGENKPVLRGADLNPNSLNAPSPV